MLHYSMYIGDKEIGNGHTYIIAELSCNHGQDINNAIELIHAAHKAGADAVKLQTYTPDTMTLDCDNEYFVIKDMPPWNGMKLYDLYKKAYTPWDWHKQLKDIANGLGMDLFSSPFDTTSVDFLESINVPCYKIASFEMTDFVLLEKVASTGKPIIMSTGIATLEEIETSVKFLKSHGVKDIVLLKCTSAYPTKLEDANLLTIKDMQERFNVHIGLSDHTKGIISPITSVALGAKVIEKHFKLEGDNTSEDAEFSLTPSEFTDMVKAVRDTEKCLGKTKYFTDVQKGSRNLRRSLFVVKDIKQGEAITVDNVKSIRPAYGLDTKYYHDIMGKTVTKDIKRGEPILLDIINH